jgi:hypothetical protein
MKKKEKKLKEKITDGGLSMKDSPEGSLLSNFDKANWCPNSCTAKSMCDVQKGYVGKCSIMCHTCYIKV